MGDVLVSGTSESPYKSKSVVLYQFGVINIPSSNSFSSRGSRSVPIPFPFSAAVNLLEDMGETRDVAKRRLVVLPREDRNRGVSSRLYTRVKLGWKSS